MPAWITNIIVAILTKLTSELLARGLAHLHAAENKKATDADIDQKLSKFKDAYKEAFNGETVTPEQRAKIQKSIAEFIRSGPPGGL